MVMEEREVTGQKPLEVEAVCFNEEVGVLKTLFAIENALSELFSFVGLGPELNALIKATDEVIKKTTDPEEKMALLKERNAVLTELFVSGLVEIYGPEQGKAVAQRILERVEKTDLKERIPQKPSRKENCFIVYPDTFGGIKELSEVIPEISKLGVTKIHLLPFFDHAGDGGYAIRYHSMEEPLRINPEWSPEEFQILVETAQAHDITILVDVVLNHMALDSPILEEQRMLEELVLSWPMGEQPFKLVRTEEDIESGGTYAVYTLGSGVEVRVLIMFPEQAGDDPLLVVHQNRDIYHTFYPFQADLDFKNPAAFELVASIVLQASEMIGRNGQLRLDAIPFIGKKIDSQFFQNMDGDDGYRIITLIGILTALHSPDINLVAEASRPMSEIERYLNRVGAAYDFISMPYFLLAVAQSNPALFYKKIQEMADSIGYEGVSKLVLALQTHDDYPLAELKDPIAQTVWKELRQKNAEPFGQVEGKIGPPKGAAVRLMEICDNNPDKLAATFALSAFTPHGDLFFLFGTGIGLENSAETLTQEAVLAQQEGRKVDKRAVIRSHLSVDEYKQQVETSPVFAKVSQVLQTRKEFLPEVITSWDYYTMPNGITEVFIVGTHSGSDIQLRLQLNYTDKEIVSEQIDQQLLLASANVIDDKASTETIEPWGYRLYKY
jgi:hypothetical protein